MAGRLLMLSALRQKPKVPFGAASISEYERCIIGKREIVGFGVNGQPHYVDHLACPFPAIRWAEDCPDIKVTINIPFLFKSEVLHKQKDKFWALFITNERTKH